jgi:hypothetical protein
MQIQNAILTGSTSVYGNMGIGIANPAYGLDVSGDVRVSGTLFGTASFALSSPVSNNATASFVTQSTWTFSHNLNNQNVIVQTYDSGYNQIIPQNIQLTNANTAVITFPISISGYAVASVGGVSASPISSSYAQTASIATSASFATTSSYALNAGSGGTTGVVTFNLQTGSYTLVAGDVGKIVRISSSVSCSVTLPDNTSVPMATGSFITIEQAGTGSVTAITGSGVTILPPARTTFGQYKVIQCYKVNTNIWNVLGGIV